MPLEEDQLRIPTAQKMQQLTELISEDEDFRFPRIKLNRDKPKFELPAPTKDDRDNFDVKATFKGVVLVARKNFYQDDESKKKNEEPKEKRVLYVLRLDKVIPEIMYVNPTSLKAWKIFAKQVIVAGQQIYGVVCEFGAEHVKSKTSGFAWNKMTFKVDRSLTKAELEHSQALRTLVDAHVKTYEDDADLDKFEDEALGIRKPDDEEHAERHSTSARTSIEADDEPKASKPGGGGKKNEAPKAEPKAEEKPAEKPAASGYPSLDEEDENLRALGGDPESGDEPPPRATRPSLDDED